MVTPAEELLFQMPPPGEAEERPLRMLRFSTISARLVRMTRPALTPSRVVGWVMG